MRITGAIATVALLLAGCASTGEGPKATAKLEPRSGSTVSGKATFTQVGDLVRITGEVNGHTAGIKGWHIHEKGDCSDPKAMSAGGHFNPRSHKHGGPSDPNRHAGDMGNLTFNEREAAFRDAEAREREAEAEAKATEMVSSAIASSGSQAINYFVAQKYVEAIGLFATSPNAKTILFPVEATALIGTLGGIGEIAKDALGKDK